MKTHSNARPQIKRIVGMTILLVAVLTILACDLAALTGGGTTGQPPQLPVAQATIAPSQPTQPPSAQATQPPASKQPTTQTFGGKKLVSPDELSSYRMKMIFRDKDASKAGDSTWTIAAVKNPPAKHVVMGNTEIITIGDKTWTKIAGKWILQPPSSSQQASTGGISDDVLRQLEEKYTLQEVGKETVNGIPCKRYTIKGEVSVPAQAGFQGEITIRAQGEAWIADQAGLPPVAIRQRGDLEMQSNVAPGAARPTTLAMKLSFESELYDINTPITITPPDGAQTAPTSPAKPTTVAKPTVVNQPTAVRSPTPKAGAPTTAPQPTVAAGAQLFADEFNSTLDSKWVWTDPVGDSSYSVKARSGFLRLSAPDGTDMWLGNYDAPRLLRPVNGNFIIETLVEFNPTSHYQGAGILIYQDNDNLLRLERGFGGLAPIGNNVSFVREGEGLVGDAAPTDATRVELRVQRVGNRFTAWWREPNKTWQQIGSIDAALQPDVQVGVLQVANWGVEQINADFDYVRISRPR